MSRLAKYREEQKRNIERIKYFCLEPKLDIFTAVIRPKNVTEECYDVWRTSALYKFSSDWDICNDPIDNSELTEEKFLAIDKKLSAVLAAPTRTLCEQLLFVFYATGELKYIDLFYQCIGIISSQSSSSGYLSTLFKETRDGYSQRIYELIAADKDHFERYNVELSSVDFSYFNTDNIEKFRQIAKDKKMAIN